MTASVSGVDVSFVPSTDHKSLTAFQFEVEGGTISDVIVYDDLADAGFEVSASDTIVLGISLTGSVFTCEESSCIMVTLIVEPEDDDSSAELCMIDDDNKMIVSDESANMIPSHPKECLSFCSATGDINLGGVLDVLDL